MTQKLRIENKVQRFYFMFKRHYHQEKKSF